MKAWKNSASLIVAARHSEKFKQISSPTYNYNLLCLKRHQKSRFMPGSYVFPGGAADPADADLKWHKLFEKFGFDNGSLSQLISKSAVPPSIYKKKNNELPREISLRITAIRETFEECGILMCRHLQKTVSQIGWAEHLSGHDDELKIWQTKVHDDATLFYTLCEQLKCYPDIWSLHEWSNWLTPTCLPGSRFNTIFYLACMPSVPPTTYETTEMEDLKWDTPVNFLTALSDSGFPPPQHYETARFAKFECIDNLLRFATERSKRGVQLYLPVRVQLSDGAVHVLPGDSMYPKEPSLLEPEIIDRTDITRKQFEDLSPIMNRMEFSAYQANTITVCNYESTEGHLSPMPSEAINSKLMNKL